MTCLVASWGLAWLAEFESGFRFEAVGIGFGFKKIGVDSDSAGLGFEVPGFGSGFEFEMPGFAYHWCEPKDLCQNMTCGTFGVRDPVEESS